MTHTEKLIEKVGGKDSLAKLMRDKFEQCWKEKPLSDDLKPETKQAFYQLWETGFFAALNTFGNFKV